MSYTIKVHTLNTANRVASELDKVSKLNGFVINDLVSKGWTYSKGSKAGSRKEGHILELRRIRLAKPKPYCGQHPGPCAVVFGKKKPVSTYLEWDDWVRFHKMVNDILDLLQADCDVWSTPHDCKGPMWIRKGAERRVRYDWEQRGNFRVWNQGTPDQFIKEPNDSPSCFSAGKDEVENLEVSTI